MPPAPDLTLPKFEFDSQALVIFGGGGQGKTVIDLVRTIGTYRLAGIVDDGLPPGSQVLGVPVLGGSLVLPELFSSGIHLAVNAVGGIGNVTARVRVFDWLAQAGFSCPALIHPSAVVEPSAQLEGGVQLLAHSYVGSDAVVGFGTLINAGVIISHDCQIGRCVNLSPGALLAGMVQVEDFAQIGMGATINIGLRVGEAARIGNGATVKGDVPGGGRVYAGATWPPRPVKSAQEAAA